MAQRCIYDMKTWLWWQLALVLIMRTNGNAKVGIMKTHFSLWPCDAIWILPQNLLFSKKKKKKKNPFFILSGFILSCFQTMRKLCIWRHCSWSTLAEEMACYLNQYWHLIKGVVWQSPKSNFTSNSQDLNTWNEFENYTVKITVTSPRSHWLKLIDPWGI